MVTLANDADMTMRAFVLAALLALPNAAESLCTVTEQWTWDGPIPPPPDLYFYRVAGVNCAGAEGP